jgi:hypothetical protein
MAQPKPLPDSIRIEIPDHQSIITFELRQYDINKRIIADFPKQLSDLLAHVTNSITEMESKEPKIIEVTYDYESEDNNKYTIKINEVSVSTTHVVVSNEAITELLPQGWELQLKMKAANIHLYTPNVERLRDLTTLDLRPVITRLDATGETLRQKRMGIISRVILQNNEVVIANIDHRTPNDMLGLHAGAGVGLFQDNFYPEFNFVTSFYFANRYKENHQRISAQYELKLFTGSSPEGEYQLRPASFVSISYALNFSKERPRWTGIGIGLLTHDRSDFFTGKTMKLFLETDIGSPKLNLIPELYLTNDYTKAIFGLKLNYKF